MFVRVCQVRTVIQGNIFIDLICNVKSWCCGIFLAFGNRATTYLPKRVCFSGPHPVNASNNWWGSADVATAYRRIYDQRRDPTVLLLNIEPVLTESTIDCSAVANCSDRGECVGPDICRCNSGLSEKQKAKSKTLCSSL